ncbi:LysM peptidoglycan-binding domain-containing protein [Streptococcus oralis]|uniref:Peptidoglycan-binding protein LysM n=1 Tax=Salmonella enterica subsp. enterica serovar Saintpaul TaxID=90105 RepID=A0A1S0Z678_SALET|nr:MULTISPECIES: LysM domain-containing protein [Streptococcus]ANR74882.1 peptidoglycan-binding protein LysM [Streptococcus sp. oral taxon 064]MCC3187311.1 LysM peptidoglycan-binding domain-containing protein [Streptococcus oralis]MCY7109100.1 LysM peptidoglycan-binding domain-containing protein [Streptococcus oralis]MCY7111066.1 LysM peptidoglycan-binding domain-containing protein [Streptococcus oralis]MDU0953156.1 LysM peptidoglycan-binding domain-containing protein [Streptococcus oralis]
MKKRIILASTVALSLAPTLGAKAQEIAWTARSVEQIQNDVTKNENKNSYTVQYGDTLSTIAEALGVDVTVLANLNKITNMDLIFPDTVLTTTVNEEEEVTEVEIQTPQTDASEEVTTATADLTTNQVTVDEQTVQVEDLSQPIEEAPTATETEKPAEVAPSSEVSETATVAEEKPSTETPVAEETAETTPAAAPVAETPVAETTSPVEEAPKVATPATEETAATTPAEAPVAAAPATETPADTTGTSAAEETAASTATSDTVTSTYQAEQSQTPSRTYSAPAAPDYAGLAVAKSENAGLQPQTAAFKEEVANLFGITSFSGYRPGDSGDHGKGLAIDFMVPVSSALGDQIAEYAVKNMASRGINYIIWKQRFYAPYDSKYGPAYTWNPMPDRGSVTENHYDHVHVSMN